MKDGRPSNTALVVAGGLQLAAYADAGVQPLAADAVARGATLLRAAYPRLARLLQQRWCRRICLALERATLPGIAAHFAHRKQLLREHAQQAIGAGCTQMVVLGAGLDTLCAELLARHPQLRCIEIDHPATQAQKRAAMGEGGAGIHFIGADLAQRPLCSVLAACPAFRPDQPALFVAEGLLMYVPPDAVARLFAQMAAMSAASWVAFTWLETDAQGRPNFRRPSRLIDAWLRLRGEPFLSGMPAAALPAFLDANGWAMQQLDECNIGEYIALGKVKKAT